MYKRQGSTLAIVRMREVKTITVGSDVKTTALSDLYALLLHHSSGNINVPELVVPESAAKFETSLAVAFALASVTFTSSPVAKSVITSLPEATVNTSSPVPPV